MRHTIRFPVAIAAAALAFAPAPAVLAQQQPALTQEIPLDPAVRMGTLPNGLRYYIQPNREPPNRVELRLAVNAGSVLEDPKQLGLAHFLEHMAFNGTRNFARNELVNYLRGVGVQFGAHLNAYTSFDETVYILPIATDSAKVVERGFQILADWAGGQMLTDEEIERERAVVIEEWRLGRGADMRMTLKQFPVALAGSAYAERLPIGTRESLQGFSAADLRRFYSDWYRPDLMAVVVVGDIDPARAEALIREKFGSMAAPRSAPPRPVIQVPAHAAPRFSVVSDPEATNTRVQVSFQHPARPTRTVADFRRGVVEGLHDAMLNARFDEITRSPNAPFVGASANRGRTVRTLESYTLFAVARENGVQPALTSLLTEAERVSQHGFTASELERAKAELLRNAERAYAEREKMRSGQIVDRYVAHFLQGDPVPGPAASYELYRALVPGVTLEDVNRLARELITDQNRVILANGPEKAGAPLPTEQALAATFAQVRGKPVAAYVDNVSTTPLLANAPRAGRVVSERRMDAIGTVEWRLSNGARVIVKPTEFKADEVVFRAYSPGGTSLASDADYPAVSMAWATVGAGGVGSMNAVQLQKALAGKAVQVNPFISGTEEGIGGTGSPKDLETLFQLIHLHFTAPRADAEAAAAFKNQWSGFLRNRDANPESAFQDTVQVTMAQGHARARPFNAAMVEAQDLARSLAFYRDRFSDAGDFTFVFVGSVRPDSLKPLVEKYLASLPSAGRRESSRDTGIRPPRGVVRKTVRRGTEPKSTTRLAFTGPIAVRPEEVHGLRSLSELLQIRLTESLRERLGGTYSASVNSSVARLPVESYTLNVQFGSAPDRVDELVRATFAEIDKIKNEGAPEADLIKVREAQRRNAETNLRLNQYWLNNLVNYDTRGWNPSAIPTEAALADRVTSASIQAAARRFLNARNYVQVVLVPETTP
jgi:zinc protease